ncbi:hypothetical protein S40285_06997 [Stachybotrys chlorohalonatus IBT 40285]|uniref:Heterokaryon incompatibility domain-containing protein n=1 Tax=Stachybotrys chlorohalonatus (strain IBT 40285) TaxID=1283841 RepID=A0A084QYC2_STAC4|nr:hypothetical protein S40285_06997 [Stachybotrys chlorohalonata IBT 40285]
MSHYRSLDIRKREIRLLHLLPAESDEPISCNLTVVSLDDRPQYEALSYVWGKPVETSAPKNIVNLEGMGVSVTPNLLLALHRLRLLPNEGLRTLWVDALCINQSDLDERSQQVSIMRDIYASAGHVLIWLGEGDDDTDAAFGWMAAFANLHGPPGGEGERTNRINLMRENSSFFFSIADRYGWFSRIWILQELAVAKSDPIIYCGQKAATWSLLLKAWEAIAEEAFVEMDMVWHTQVHYGEEDLHGLIPVAQDIGHGPVGQHKGPDVVRPMMKIDVLNDLRTATQREGGDDLARLFRVSRTSESTDPRDRIYGLLGLIRNEGHDSISDVTIPIDYNKSTSEVYTDAMAYIFSRGEGPYFLSGVFLAGLNAEAPLIPSLPHGVTQPGLPSWVPDFTRQIAPKALQPPGIIFYSPAGLNNGGATGAGAGCNNGRCLEDRKTLRVEGLVVDTVKQVIRLGESLDDLIDGLPRLEALSAEARAAPCAAYIDASIAQFVQRFKRSEELWRVLISNKKFNSGYETAPLAYEDSYRKLLDQATSKIRHGHEQPDAAQDEYKQCLRGGIGKRVLFITESGFVGTSVPDTREEDTVVILFGAPTAFTLRQMGFKVVCGKDVQVYGLVGAAYVGGIMGGEMVDELYCEDLMDSTTFYIQ